MTERGSRRAVVESALVEAHRHLWASVLAATVPLARDLDLAEECVQEAYAAAVSSWVRDGVPAKPAAWLTTAAEPQREPRPGPGSAGRASGSPGPQRAHQAQ